MLLAALDEHRPTRDVDLAGLQFDNTVEKVTDAIVEIASVAVDDGLVIATDQASAEVIREESEGYSGVRVSLPATLASARVSFHVDVNVGDPIHPAPEPTAVPPHPRRRSARRLDTPRCRVPHGDARST